MKNFQSKLVNFQKKSLFTALVLAILVQPFAPLVAYANSNNVEYPATGNQSPAAPAVTGPTVGNSADSYTFTAVSTDPDNDQVRYGGDWNNDGTIDEYTAFVPSGTGATFTRTFVVGGNHLFRIYAEDFGGHRSSATPYIMQIAQAPVIGDDAAPIGVLDSANCDVISGWTYDSNSPSLSNDVHFYADGLAGVGTFLGGMTANEPRPDVNTYEGITGNHGFTFATPNSIKDGNTHEIFAYGINTNPANPHNNNGRIASIGPITISGCVPPVVVNNAPSAPTVTGPTNGITTESYTFTATATDPEADQVRYGGDWNNDGTIDEYTNLVASGSSATFTRTFVVGGHHLFHVYAEDSAGHLSVATEYIIDIVQAPVVTGDKAPIGVLDSATCDIISGWTYDPDTASTSNDVHFYADGLAGTGTFLGGMTANGSRPDVNAYENITGNHAFVFATPASLKDGATHEIFAYGINTNPEHPHNNNGRIASIGPITISGCTTVPPVNGAPTAPVVGGPTNGITTESYVFTATSTDPDGDQVRYGGDWNNDGTIDEYTNLVASGSSATFTRTFVVGGHHLFHVYAEDSKGNKSTATSYIIDIVQAPVITDDKAPIGVLDSATCDIISGWTYDPDTSSVSNDVHFYADGLAGVGTFLGGMTANESRPDVNAYENIIGNHGFTFHTPSSLKDGAKHEIFAYGINTNPEHPHNNNGRIASIGPITITGCTNGGDSTNHAPSKPVITGPATGIVGVSQTFTATATDSDGNDISYGFDWDNNGTVDTWSNPVPSGVSASASFIWNTVGDRTISVVARDSKGVVSEKATFHIEICSQNNHHNTAPVTPTVSGPTTGTVNTSYSFTAQATDADGDTVSYGFDWNNDGTPDEFTAVVASGVSGSINHIFTTVGTFPYKVFAKDSKGDLSSPANQSMVISAGGGSGCGNSCPTNTAPVLSAITGPTTGSVNNSYTFTAVAIDAENDTISYAFDWDNDGAITAGSGEDWSSLASSSVAVSRSNSWTTGGLKIFQALARDSHGATSATSTSIQIAGAPSNIGFNFGTSTEGLTTSEAGATAVFTVALNSAPLANVTMPVMSSDFTEGTTSVSILTFTPSNWNISQTITVTGIEDSEVDGNISYSVVVGPSTSTDVNWNNVGAQSVSLINYDNDTAPVVTNNNGGGSTGGGGGGGGGGNGGPCIGFNCPAVTTTATSTTATTTDSRVLGDVLINIGGTTTNFGPGANKFCKVDEYITTYMRLGADNNPNEVRKLQSFLNEYDNAGLNVDGIFGSTTEDAVKVFQSNHSDTVLAPWGVSEPTGIVYITTSNAINRIYCGDNPDYTGRVLDGTVDNSGYFDGLIGSATTTEAISNMASVFSAISQKIKDFLKDIWWYLLLIIILIIVGTVLILKGQFQKSVTEEVTHDNFMRGAAILSIGTVLNVLNTLSFMLSPNWLLSNTAIGLDRLLVLDLINLFALVIICIGGLISLYNKANKVDVNIDLNVK